MTKEIDIPPAGQKATQWKLILRNTAYILGGLFIFLFAIDLMISSLQHLGGSAVELIILATSNPFTGLFIGLLITAIIQSSSATTSMVVALVASGSMTLEGAVPIIMGANIGTTITSTIVSLGFITRKKEFRRAVSAGTYHDFFNILTVLILFPLEYYYGFLSNVSGYIANSFFDRPITSSGMSLLGTGLGALIHRLVEAIDNGFILIVISFGLLFGSILFFRKILSDVLGLRIHGRLQEFFFRNPIKSFAWGLGITALIRSSTITTSLVVPLVAKKVVKLSQAVPFILGANVGTTITAFIAATSHSNIAISIAIAHLLFNLIGVIFFSLVPWLNKLPSRLAKGLGRLTIRFRLAGFLYILLTFFFIPFSLIYLNKNAVTVRELTYQKISDNSSSQYRMLCKTFRNQQVSSWIIYNKPGELRSEPSQILSVERRRNLLMINNELFELNNVGYCRDGMDADGKYRMCIREIIPHMEVNASLKADSVFVFEKNYTSTAHVLVYISAVGNVILKKEKSTPAGGIVETHELLEIVEK
jgi:sodium-dependent phosphate cotransporter